MKAYIEPALRAAELPEECMLCVSNAEEEETVDITFTTSTPSTWEPSDEMNLE